MIYFNHFLYFYATNKIILKLKYFWNYLNKLIKNIYLFFNK